MRILAVLAAALFVATAFAPVAAATPSLPPYCPICVIVLQIVVPCVVAEAQQDVLNQGAGCPMINVAQDFAACTAENVLLVLGFGNGCRT